VLFIEFYYLLKKKKKKKKKAFRKGDRHSERERERRKEYILIVEVKAFRLQVLNQGQIVGFTDQEGEASLSVFVRVDR